MQASRRLMWPYSREYSLLCRYTLSDASYVKFRSVLAVPYFGARVRRWDGALCGAPLSEQAWRGMYYREYTVYMYVLGLSQMSELTRTKYGVFDNRPLC